MTINWSRVEKLVGKENLTLLRQKRVGVVGLGSGGGFVAQALAMSGVGRFVLIDDDTLEPANVVRHVADLRDVGRPKAEVMADLLRQRSPEADIVTRVGRMENHWDALAGIDLVVCGVDGEGPKYKLNAWCLEQRVHAVYAGVYERGEGGDVVFIRPYDGPCYACWAAALREGLPVHEAGAGQPLDYGMIGPEGTLEAEPGLWLHVVRVAAAQADLALNALFAGTSAYRPSPANTVILANTRMEILSGEVALPFTAEWVQIERDPHCLVCGQPAAAQAVSLDELMMAAGLQAEERLEENDRD